MSEYEHGHKSPTVRTLERLLAGCGLQLRVSLEPLQAGLDSRVDAMLTGSPDSQGQAVARLAEWLEDRIPPPPTGRAVWGRLPMRGPVTWAIDGRTALAMHGFAVSAAAEQICGPQLVVVLDEALRFWLRSVGLRGQSPQGWTLEQSWLDVEPDVLKQALPGVRLCQAGWVEVRVVDALPTVTRMTLEVPGDLLDPDGPDEGPRAPGSRLDVPVLPVHEVEQAHPELAELLARWRARGQPSSRSATRAA